MLPTTAMTMPTPASTPSASRPQNGPSKQSDAANEFWLDFKTDRNGRASVLTTHYWGIAKGQHANSVVITSAGAHEPAACVTVPFKRLNPRW